jgi:hypothetical protein
LIANSLKGRLLMETVARAERKLYALALIVAPLLLALSTFFWQGDSVHYTGGIIQVYSFVFWIPAFLGLLSLLRPTMPAFSVWGILLIAYVSIAGNNFGMEGIYLAAFEWVGADAAQVAAVEGAMPVGGLLVLFIPGSLYPLTLLLLGFLLWRNRAVPPLLALLLCLGAIAFPLSRIPRIELLAHLADVLLLIGAGGIGWLLWQGETKVQAAPRAVGAGDD